MRYKDLLLLSVMWGVCASTLESRDLLACEYTPSERVSNGRFGSKRLTPIAIRRRYLEADNYATIHPVFKEWIEQNKANYRYLASGESLLYVNDEDGIGIYEKGGHIFLYRTRLFGDDQAWEYQKEPAINPQTDRPWIELSASELRTVMRGGKKMDEPDQQFLKDVLSILNENFHYFYGMQFVDLGRDPDVDPAQLMGKFISLKIVLFGKNTDALDLSDYSAQQASLYRTLGHPIYSYEGLLETDILGIGSDCGGKGKAGVTIAKDISLSLSFFNQVSPSEVNPSKEARASQLVNASAALRDMMEGLEQIIQQKGGSVRSLSMNKTPLTRALCLTYQKANRYVEAIATNEYVNSSFGMGAFDEGVNHLYDVVPIKGLYDGRSSKASSRSSSRASSRSSSRIKASSSKNKRRAQRSGRERN